MKHASLIFLIALFVAGCGPPEFEKNTRILVKGQILDSENIPIQDLNIGVYSARSTSFIGSGEFSFLLGHNNSKTDGSFMVTSLFDRDEDFSIEIDGGEDFSNYIYAVNTKDYIPSDLTFNLGTITLSKLAKVNLNITRSSPIGTEFRFLFRYTNPKCIEFYIEDQLDKEKTSLFKNLELGYALNNNRSEISRTINSLLGSEIIFTYQINNEPEIIETFIIDDENYEFNFSY